jgi:hypothetical protein
MKVKFYQTFVRPDLNTLMYQPHPKIGRYIVENYEKTGKKTCPCGENFEDSHHPIPGAYVALEGYWPEDDHDKLTTEHYTEFTSEEAWQEFNNDPVINKMRVERNKINESRGITLSARVVRE